MRCPGLNILPAAPSGKRGWPWTEASLPPPDSPISGDAWPRISVVTPSFNQGQFLEETIRSVLLQRYPDIEYIVIDGGSTDNSRDIIERYSPWLHYWVSEPDRGQSHAVNKGFSASTGTILAYINSDDFYEPHALETAATAFMRPERPQLLTGDCIIFDEKRVKRTFEAFWPEHIGHLLKPFGSTFAQPAAFWSRAVYEQVGGFDESLHYAFDREFFLKIGLAGTAPLIMRKPLARYRDHPATKTSQTIHFYQESIPVIHAYADRCGLGIREKENLLRLCRDEIGYLTVFIRWKQGGRYAGLLEFMRLLMRSPWLLRQRKILGQGRRLLFFREDDVAELRNV